MKEKNSLAVQYYQVKEKHMEAIVFFQVGGFYQTYHNDALILNRELGMRIILRSIGEGRKNLVCGMPVASGIRCANELVKEGYKVLICNQVKDESGVVMKREVVQVFKPRLVTIDVSSDWTYFLANYDSMMGPYLEQENNIKKEALDMKEKNHDELTDKVTKWIQEISEIEPMNLTPMDAMQLIIQWKQKYSVV